MLIKSGAAKARAATGDSSEFNMAAYFLVNGEPDLAS
jgi:hypothetical protein